MTNRGGGGGDITLFEFYDFAGCSRFPKVQYEEVPTFFDLVQKPKRAKHSGLGEHQTIV